MPRFTEKEIQENVFPQGDSNSNNTRIISPQILMLYYVLYYNENNFKTRVEEKNKGATITPEGN